LARSDIIYFFFHICKHTNILSLLNRLNTYEYHAPLLTFSLIKDQFWHAYIDTPAIINFQTINLLCNLEIRNESIWPAELEHIYVDSQFADFNPLGSFLLSPTVNTTMFVVQKDLYDQPVVRPKTQPLSPSEYTIKAKAGLFVPLQLEFNFMGILKKEVL
jgi:hypothetical protein